MSTTSLKALAAEAGLTPEWVEEQVEQHGPGVVHALASFATLGKLPFAAELLSIAGDAGLKALESYLKHHQ